MILTIVLIVLYVLPLWYNITFIKKAHGKGGVHEGDEFEGFLLFATFVPVFNLVFAFMGFFSTPYDYEKSNWDKIKVYLIEKIYGIK